MENDVTVVYAREEPPSGRDAAVFLADPPPRSRDVPSWRPGRDPGRARRRPVPE